MIAVNSVVFLKITQLSDSFEYVLQERRPDYLPAGFFPYLYITPAPHYT